MKVLLFGTALLAYTCAASSSAADEEAGKKSTRNEAIRAQMIEDAKKQAAKPAPPSGTKPTPATQKTEADKATDAASTVAGTPANATTSAATTAQTAAEPATVLPQIEVNRSKVSPLARELFEKERELDREKQLTKSSELDKALNNPKVSVPLFGGQSTASRTSVASERASLLQAEADLIEEIGRAKTKEQKAELRKQLDELKKIRRELEHAIR
jgi:hypothetical protein